MFLLHLSESYMTVNVAINWYQYQCNRTLHLSYETACDDVNTAVSDFSPVLAI